MTSRPSVRVLLFTQKGHVGETDLGETGSLGHVECEASLKMKVEVPGAG